MNGAKLLITGGTGSFGHAVLEKFLPTETFSEIRIFSRDEKKQDDMRNRYKDRRIQFYIGDVRDQFSVDTAMQGVDYVFHAAALKQVPSCEFFPIEATRTNVIGTQHVLNAAIQHKVKKVVCLSTDKAAYPINAMGITKALMEKVAIAASRNTSDTIICVTRYGNVMGSRGSVIPLFLDQIQQGKQLTITDPGMTRFLMSLTEAVELVLFAFEHAAPGDLFVHKAPACTIDTLAQAICSLAKIPYHPQIIGTRHGEKLYETLCTREEMTKAQNLGEFYCIPADNRDLNYSQYFQEGRDLGNQGDYTSQNTQQLSLQEVITTLKSLPFMQSFLANR
ncbi:MAG: NAD-dependent epimerase/dehydratase family protein [Sediminibacterium sp.]|nr:NAD-dependent epimerase/dehydratase family protein [Sediminibacterium sp.]